MKWRHRYIDVPPIPIGGRNCLILDILLQRTGFYDWQGNFILLHTVRENIERFSYLIWDKKEDNPYDQRPKI